MSGGSWSYAYRQIEELADSLMYQSCPLRRAMAPKVYQLSKAMHDVEWVDRKSVV